MINPTPEQIAKREYQRTYYAANAERIKAQKNAEYHAKKANQPKPASKPRKALVKQVVIKQPEPAVIKAVAQPVVNAVIEPMPERTAQPQPSTSIWARASRLREDIELQKEIDSFYI